MNKTTLALCSEFVDRFSQGAIEAFDELTPQSQLELLNHLNPESSVRLIIRVNPGTIAEVLPKCDRLKDILPLVDASYLAKIFAAMDSSASELCLSCVSESTRKDIEGLRNYPPNTAGSLMEVRIQLFHPEDTVEQAISKLRKIRARNIASVYLVDFQGVLQGRVYLQDMIGANDGTKLNELSKPTPWVNEMAPKDEIVEVVEQNRIPSVPVLNSENSILGVIRHEQLVSMVHEDAFDDLQKMVGVSKDEKALSTPLFSVKKRLPWLTVNLVTTFIAAFVVGIFEDTIAKITALAVLLPVVAGQSGNTGAQAQAVTMRGLALREIRLRHKWRVLVKEGTVGLINGLVVGVLCAVSVYFWSQSLPLGLVIGVAMIFAMVAASLSGAAVPMILSALGQDPATSSSIILTTITDIVGFLSFLGLAAVFANYLI